MSRVRRAAAVAGLALSMALTMSACSDSDTGAGTFSVVDSGPVEDVPACTTGATRMLDDMYYGLLGDREEQAEWAESHPLPDDEGQAWGRDVDLRLGPDPMPQASAAWDDERDSFGTLYVYEDGVARYVSSLGTESWFTQEEQTYDAVC